ncbi:MAG: 4-hydroxyphenylacetate 3-hydroxylase N-terminal domain-containing protein [bacterium]|nr:4-hydroxyphenylacetate 3-hydroxylase N-terminal domain-containing protein [bacterium]
MALKTGSEYLASLRGRELTAYFLGERVEEAVDHPFIGLSARSVAATYDLTGHREHGRLATTVTPGGRTVNRFTHIHRSATNLVDKVKLQRILGRATGACFQRCVGWDALNALFITTHEMDEKLGTGYHRRFQAFLEHVQEEDLVCQGAMTDVKGDRSARPGAQEDRDLYLRVIGRGADHLVVRGAKAHQTGALCSHEIIVMPTLALREDEEEYAIAFAIPATTPGISHVVGRQVGDQRCLYDPLLDRGNACFGGHEALTVFDDVRVPLDRVFMAGEVAHSGRLVERFAAFHRQSYGGCKAGVGDVLIGAAALAAEHNGVAGAAHVRDKLVEMVHLNETIYSCGLACSLEGRLTPAGSYMVDPLLANVCKHNVTRLPYEIARLAQDLAGGLVCTLPSARDLEHPLTGPVLRKYLKGVPGVTVEDRMRVLRLIEHLTLGRGAASYLPESLHGAGSPQAQRVVIARTAPLEECKQAARVLAGMGIS